MTREDAALDKAMEASEERARLIELAEQQNPTLEALKHDMALGEIKDMLTETDAEKMERSDKAFAAQYAASKSQSVLSLSGMEAEKEEEEAEEDAAAEEGVDCTAGAGWQRPEEMLTATASTGEDFLTAEQVQQHMLDDLREQGDMKHVQS